MLAALMLILAPAGLNGAQSPAGKQIDSQAASSEPSPAAPAPAVTVDVSCHSQDREEILVCGQRRQGFRIDPAVMDGAQGAADSSASATAAMPVAQATCAGQPSGCSLRIDSLDLANVAIVVGAMGLRALRGEDWARALKTGGTDEYQLYLQARQRRETQETEKRAEAARAKARANR